MAASTRIPRPSDWCSHRGPTACTVTLVGTIELSESHNQVAARQRRRDIGLDANGDGQPDGCDGPPIPPGPHPFVANAADIRSPAQHGWGGCRTAIRFRFATMPAATTAVLYGGEHLFGGEILSDTWTFNGEAWTPNCGTTVPGATGDCSPGARLGHAMGTAPNGVVLYGGVRSGGLGQPLDGQSGLAPVPVRRVVVERLVMGAGLLVVRPPDPSWVRPRPATVNRCCSSVA